MIKPTEAEMASWQVQDAKARFSELLNATLKNGPQVVTRRGVETAVLVPIKEWQSLQQAARPGIKEWLLNKGPRFENLVGKRGRLKHRPLPEFE